MEFDPDLTDGVAELVELIGRGELDRAEARADALLARYPAQVELWRLRGICALQKGDVASALKALRIAVGYAPRSVEVLCNLASALTAEGSLGDAEDALRKALAIEPLHVAALNNLGSLLDSKGDFRGAADCFARALSQRPDYARAWLNQASTLLTLRRLDRAEASARRAIQLAPQWADARFVLGNILSEAGGAGAVEAYTEATSLAPADPRFHYQLALALDARGDYAAAIDAHERALTLDHEFWPALSQLAYLKRRVCDWSRLDALSQRLIAGVDGAAAGITPFSFLVEDSSPAQQLACARTFAAIQSRRASAFRAPAVASRGVQAGAPRIGFVSSGFVEHPTALLVVELVERLRESSLQTVAFATTRDDGGVLRSRLEQGFHEFHDLSSAPLHEALEKIRAARIDVLVDLDGYCQDSRPELFASRPAPLQVNWLAYPGSLGAPWYDYLIADRVVIPAEQRRHYDESIAWLPRCYQPTDTTRPVGVPPPREHFGLPADAVVYASFNNSWKITPATLQRWCEILRAVPDGVLWLLTGPIGSGADERLCDAAAAAGVAPERIVFAERLAPAGHLARYRHADLFLDTNPYNAHTTASDAAWAGCPVLTRPGETFASRVAASINHHLGIDDLICASDAAYVGQAVRLGTDRAALRALRERVAAARNGSGLFDMAGYTRDFEALLLAMFKRRRDGYDAQDIEPDRAS